MSQENVELVRRAIELVNRGDYPLAVAEADPDFEMDWSNSIGPLNGIYRGRGQVTEVWESFREAWDELRFGRSATASLPA